MKYCWFCGNGTRYGLCRLICCRIPTLSKYFDQSVHHSLVKFYVSFQVVERMNNSGRIVRQLLNHLHPKLSSVSSQKFCSRNDENLYPSHVLTKDPLKRAFRILKNEFKDIIQGKFSLPESKVFPSHVDVLVVGGGIIGSSIAYWIRSKIFGEFRVCVIDKDLTVGHPSKL